MIRRLVGNIALVGLLAIILGSCTSTPKPPPDLTTEGDLSPDWKTHQHDEKIINSQGPSIESQKALHDNPDMELELQQYITINYLAIGKDIQQKRGKYLPGLLKIMKVSRKNAHSSIQQITKFYKNSKDANQFSENILKWLKGSN